MSKKPAESRAVRKLEDDLAYRLPTSRKPLSTIVMSREIAEELLQEIYDLRIRAGEKEENP
jgi:hypothetical protein